MSSNTFDQNHNFAKNLCFTRLQLNKTAPLRLTVKLIQNRLGKKIIPRPLGDPNICTQYSPRLVLVCPHTHFLLRVVTHISFCENYWELYANDMYSEIFTLTP